ncbi:MAG: hypothetical protein R3B09_24240 [Nannocystaceae bacterium]
MGASKVAASRVVAALSAAAVVGGCHFGARLSTPEGRCWPEHCQRAGDCCPTLAELDGTVAPRELSSACVLLDNGRVLCHGYNDDGAAGIGRSGIGWRMPWLAVRGLVDAVDLATEWGTRCAIQANGEVVCWGSSDDGQVGWGRWAHGASPVRAPIVAPASKVELAEGSGCALKGTGEVVCWGLGRRGAYDRADCPPDRWGRRRCWGARGQAVMVTDAVDLAGNSDGYCAARQDGRVVCWADDRKLHVEHRIDDRPWVYPPAEFPEALAVVALERHGDRTWALDEDGRASLWGLLDTDGPCHVVPPVAARRPLSIASDAPIVQVAADCGLGADGRVRCWDRRGGLQVVDGLPLVAEILPGEGPDHERCAVDLDGDTWCWRSDAPPGRWRGLPDPFRANGRALAERRCPMRCPAFAAMGWSWADGDDG